MDRYARVTRLEERNGQAVPTPRVRIDRALEEMQRPGHHEARQPEQDTRDPRTLPRRDHSHSSQVSSSRMTEDHLETLYLQQSRLLGVLQAPKVNISTFDWDPMGYFPFIRAFEENVEKLLDDEGSKLTRLMQLCTGKAARALQCCSMLPPAQGYQKARQILKARFGDPFTITEVWVNKLIEGGPRTNLQEYADDLQNCYECLTALRATGELQSQSSLVALVRKLPPSLPNRWTWSTNSRRERADSQSSRTSSSLPDARQPWQPIRCMERSARSPAVQTRTPRGRLTPPSLTWDAPCVRKGDTKYQAAPRSSEKPQEIACRQPSERDYASYANAQGTSRGIAPPGRHAEREDATSGTPPPFTKPTGASSGRKVDGEGELESPSHLRTPLQSLSRRPPESTRHPRPTTARAFT